MYLTQHLERTFADAEQEAKKRRDELSASNCCWWRCSGQGGKAAELLREAGVTTEKLEQAVKRSGATNG